jgi:hypothetical protein
MISPKTTAMVVAVAAVAVIGAFATIGNQAVFAQVTNTNNNNQPQTGTVSCSASESGVGTQVAIITCWNDQELGNCQVNIGENDNSEASSDFQSGSCS